MQVGDRVGDWVVERPLGAGGMGSVYLCRGALTDRVRAALKVLHGDSELGTRERFVREVDTLASLEHPAIVRVLSGGEDPERQMLYLFMEYVEGEDLASRLTRGALPVALACALAEQVASGLAHAHARGVTHRDIKPANIMLCAGDRARIVDFGIAAVQGRTALTREGSLPGTMPYVDPAAFEGDEVEPASGDVYALGLVMWECIRGEAAFPEDPTHSDGQRMAAMLGRKLRAEAFDPGASCSEELRELVRRATAPDPKQRPTMAALHQGLVTELERLGVERVTGPVTVITERAAPRSRTGLFVGALLAAMLLVGAVPVLLLLIVALGGVGVYLQFEPTPQQPVIPDSGPVFVPVDATVEIIEPEEPESPAEATEPAPKPVAKPVAKPVPKPVAKPVPKPIARPKKLAGMRINILHRKGQIDVARKAQRTLQGAGAVVTVNRGNEGGMWEPFWGNLYYFRDDLADEADTARGMLASLGYLDTKHTADKSDLDMTIWVQSAP